MVSKNMVEPEGPQTTSQYGAYALHAGKARLHAGTHMHTPTLTHARSHTLTHPHTEKNVILIAFSIQLLRERTSILSHTYIACFFKFNSAV
jgi:hypothetical protein